MDFESLQRAWAAHGAALERATAVNERALRELLVRRARVGLLPYAALRAVEVALAVGAFVAAARLLVARSDDARYVAVAGAVAVYAASFAAFAVRLLVGALRLDGAAPVAALQRDVETLRLVEYRALLWAVLGGAVVWLPLPLVVLEALGADGLIARVDGPWLAANVLVGIGALVAGVTWSKRVVERPNAPPWARRLVDAVTGRGLRRAAERLAELRAYVRDEAPPQA